MHSEEIRGKAFRETPCTTSEAPAVLVVEDDAAVRTLLLLYVQRLGFRAIGVTNGTEALEALRDPTPYALVLTDLHMPHMDGIRLIETMRRDPRLASIPLVQVTAAFERSDPRFPCLTKPFTMREVEALVRAYARVRPERE